MKNFKKVIALISSVAMLSCTGLTVSNYKANAQAIIYNNGNDIFTNELTLDYSFNLKGTGDKMEVLTPNWLHSIASEGSYVLRPKTKEAAGALSGQYDNDFFFLASPTQPQIIIDVPDNVNLQKELSKIDLGNKSVEYPYVDGVSGHTAIIKGDKYNTDTAKQLISIYKQFKANNPDASGNFVGNYSFQHADSFDIYVSKNCAEEKKEKLAEYLSTLPVKINTDNKIDTINSLYFDSTLTFDEVSEVLDKIVSFINDISENNDIDITFIYTESLEDNESLSFDLDDYLKTTESTYTTTAMNAVTTTTTLNSTTISNDSLTEPTQSNVELPTEKPTSTESDESKPEFTEKYGVKINLKAADANGDGKVDSSDATVILKDYAENLLDVHKAISTDNDANGDGVVDSSDATTILIYYAGKLLG